MKITKIYLLGCTTSVMSMLAETSEATKVLVFLSVMSFILDAIISDK